LCLARLGAIAPVLLPSLLRRQGTPGQPFNLASDILVSSLCFHLQPVPLQPAPGEDAADHLRPGGGARRCRSRKARVGGGGARLHRRLRRLPGQDGRAGTLHHVILLAVRLVQLVDSAWSVYALRTPKSTLHRPGTRLRAIAPVCLSLFMQGNHMQLMTASVASI
jgi:hypothetical protein